MKVALRTPFVPVTIAPHLTPETFAHSLCGYHILLGTPSDLPSLGSVRDNMSPALASALSAACMPTCVAVVQLLSLPLLSRSQDSSGLAERAFASSARKLESSLFFALGWVPVFCSAV